MKTIKKYLYFIFKQLREICSQRAFFTFIFLGVSFALLNRILIPIYEEYFITKLLSKIESIPRNDIIFLIAFMALLFLSIKRIRAIFLEKKRLGLIQCFYAIILLILYLYYRNKQEYCWAHFNYFTYTDVRYFDLIVVESLLLIIEYFIGFKVKFSRPIYDSVPIHIDLPLKNSSLDLLGRKQFAKEIAKRIKSTYAKDCSMAIGIDGNWGTGKTSFVNMIKEFIAADGGKNGRIIVEFHPWKSNSPQQIISDFFEVFIGAVENTNRSLSKKISRYAKTLTKVDENIVTKSMEGIMELFDKDESKQDQYFSINESLRNQFSQIIVVIDDIDRLDKKEIIEVIRLIRNTASFHNTIFIVTYEKRYLLSALKELNEYKFKFYLEKIFQFEFNLPTFDKTILKTGIRELIFNGLLESHKSDFDSVLFPPENSFQSPDFFKINISNYRDVNRYVNSFLFDYGFIKDEIDIKDFTVLQLLKLKHPDVYDLLYENKNRFFEIKKDDRLKSDQYIIRYESGMNQTDKKNGNSVFKSYLKSGNHPVSHSDWEIAEMENLIGYLFESNSTWGKVNPTDKKSICITDNFYKYFANSIFAGEIPINIFDSELRGNYEDFTKKMDQWLAEEKINDILVRLSRIFVSDLKSKTEFENFIKGIFYFGAHTARPGSGYFFDMNHLFNLLSREAKDPLIKNWYDNDYAKYQNFIRGILKSAPSPFSFESYFIRTLKHYYSNSFVLLDEEIQEIQLEYLKKYLEAHSSFDKNIWTLIYDNKIFVREPNGPGSNKIHENYNPEVTPLIVQFIEKNDLLAAFLESLLWLEPFEKELYGIAIEPIDAIFGSLENFEVYLKKQNKDSPEVIEFRAFLYRIKELGKGYISFDFNFLTPNKGEK